MGNKQILINSFLKTAEKFPDAAAITVSGTTYSYKELFSFAALICNSILKNVKNEDRLLGVYCEKNIYTYAGVLAILLSGKGYVPLNPRFPAERNKQIFDAAGLSGLVCDPDRVAGLQQILGEDPVFIAPAESQDYKVKFQDISFAATEPDDTAYLLFTSGSTGQPKGVPVSNANVTAYIDNILELFELLPGDRFSQTFDLTFDLSVHDLFVCWAAGGHLIVPDENSTFSLFKYLVDNRINVWFSVPSVANLFARMRLLKTGRLPDLRISFFCGEPLMASVVEIWQKAAPESRVFNLYGPTETTIAISFYECLKKGENKSKNGILSIGKAFKDHDFVLLDENNQLASSGEQGMLHISGPQVVACYFNQPEQTRQSFCEIPAFGRQRFYNTGDLVIKDIDGDYYFLGRKDNEVKISGYRVNLLEIDHAITSGCGVELAATILGQNGLPVSFIQGHEAREAKEILQKLQARLPWYMVPEKIIFVETMPLNANGKIDRNQLKAMM